MFNVHCSVNLQLAVIKINRQGCRQIFTMDIISSKIGHLEHFTPNETNFGVKHNVQVCFKSLDFLFAKCTLPI